MKWKQATVFLSLIITCLLVWGCISDEEIPSTTYSFDEVEFKLREAPAAHFPTGVENDGEGKVNYPFWVGEIPVTYQLWFEVREWAEENGYVFDNLGREGNSGRTGREPSEDKMHPVTNVNLFDAMVWCNALSEYFEYKPVYISAGEVYRDSSDRESGDRVSVRNTEGFRLPFPEEWELAARYQGNDDSHGAIEYPEGSGKYWTPGTYASGATGPYTDEEATMEAAWFEGNSGLKGESPSTQPVGKKPVEGNALQLYDMSGNVFEWTYTTRVGYPTVPGGSYHGGPELLQIGDPCPRDNQSKTENYINVGLRIFKYKEVPSPGEGPETVEELEFSPGSFVEAFWRDDIWLNARILEAEENYYQVRYEYLGPSGDTWLFSSDVREREQEPAISHIEREILSLHPNFTLADVLLPEEVEVTLEDGTVFVSPVEWDTTGLETFEDYEMEVEGQLVDLPDNLTNPGNIQPRALVQVRDEEEGPLSFLRLGENTGVDGLLFYIENDDGTIGYYFGEDTDLTHLIVEENGEFQVMIVFDEKMFPIQWVYTDLTIKVLIPEDEDFDLAEALHIFLLETEEENLTLDVRYDQPAGSLVEKLYNLPAREMRDYVPGFRTFLQEEGLFQRNVVDIAREASKPEDIALAAMLSLAGAGMEMLDQLVEIGGVESTETSNPVFQTAYYPASDKPSFSTVSDSEWQQIREKIAKKLLEVGKFKMGGTLVQMFSYLNRLASGYYDGLDIEGPAVGMLLCRGASSVPNVCHEFYLPYVSKNISRCTRLCFATLSCFTDICQPIMFSVEKAKNLRQP